MTYRLDDQPVKAPTKEPTKTPERQPERRPEREPERILPPEPLCPSQKIDVTRRIKGPFVK